MGVPNIEQRKFSFCPSLTTLPLDRLIVECKCGRFFAACCQHNSFGGDWSEPEVQACHHFQLVFTDGACSNNGKVYAKAGLGISIGGDEYSWSIPVDDAIDSRGPRTNQRAELLAAIEGLKKLHQLNLAEGDHEELAMYHEAKSPPVYILVTDSEYVTKGITEWFPVWRSRRWRTSEGKQPTNLDLFMALDACVTSLEQDHIEVGFWHVPRAYNKMADSLAKRATGV